VDGGFGQEDSDSAAGYGHGLFDVHRAGVSDSLVVGRGAFLIGAIALAYPLLWTSRLVQQGDVVMEYRRLTAVR
jgi:hypothetical protein